MWLIEFYSIDSSTFSHSFKYYFSSSSIVCPTTLLFKSMRLFIFVYVFMFSKALMLTEAVFICSKYSTKLFEINITVIIYSEILLQFWRAVI